MMNRLFKTEQLTESEQKQKIFIAVSFIGYL